MMRFLLLFACGVFAVWYLPAMLTAFGGSQQGLVVILLAGTLVSAPLTVLATAGAFVGALVTRRTAPSKAWQSAAVGVLAGLLSQFFSRAVESLPQLVQPIAGAASSLHVFVRVFIIGLALGIASLVFLGAPKDKHAA